MNLLVPTLTGALLVVGALAGCTTDDPVPEPPAPVTATPLPTAAAVPPTPSPTASPTPSDPAWPAAMDFGTAISGQQNPLSVVWLATASLATDDVDATLDPVTAQVDAAGYDGSAWPLSCQDAAYDQLGVTRTVEGEFGVGVIFAVHADAETFSRLWTGPELGIVDGDVFCDLG
ncbi:hypothetical protein ACGIF2_06960 [Cellulomonas sp. P22]|uniref:hypothetical protein n=1 Tax=Cellulomonas sp. P22 TaxID=3373189 RepID=UPI003792CF01